MSATKPALEWRTDDEIDNQWHAEVGGILLQVDLTNANNGYSWTAQYIDSDVHDRDYGYDSLRLAQLEAERSALRELVHAVTLLLGQP